MNPIKVIQKHSEVTAVIKNGIYNIAKSTLKNPNFIQMMAYKSMRESLYWGYNIDELKIENEKEEVKREIWDSVKGLGLTKEEAIKASKALYFIYHYANREY